MSIILPPNARGPLLTLTLPAIATGAAVVVRNTTTGKELALNLPPAWGGNDLTLDFYRQTIKDEGGFDRSSLLDAVVNSLWIPEPVLAGVNALDIKAFAPPVAGAVKTPGTVASGGSGTTAWVNPANAKVADNVYTTFTPGGAAVLSRELECTNFGFTVPAGAILSGAKFSVERKTSVAASMQDQIATLLNVAGHGNLAAAGGWATPEIVVPYGGEFSFSGQPGAIFPEWGPIPSNAEVEAAIFGFSFQAKSLAAAVASVDAVTGQLFYRPKIAMAISAALRWERGYY
jgi:hypothetical protein